MSHLIVKCKKCRSPVADSSITRLTSGHEGLLNSDNVNRPLDENECTEVNNAIYLMEQTLPDWMISQIDEHDWIKGKLHCLQCTSRLGTFDFVSGRKCKCGKNVLPPVHLIKNKLDFSATINNYIAT